MLGAMTEKEALDKAIQVAGSQEELAALLSAHLNRRVKQQNISYWKRAGRVTPKMVPAVEAVTGVSRHELRPDIFPREVDAA